MSLILFYIDQIIGKNTNAIVYEHGQMYYILIVLVQYK